MAEQPDRYLEPWDRAADRTQSRVIMIGWCVGLLLVASVAVLATRYFAHRDTPQSAHTPKVASAPSDLTAGGEPPEGTRDRAAAPSPPAQDPPVPAGDNAIAKVDSPSSATHDDATRDARDSAGESATTQPAPGASGQDALRLAPAAGLVPLPAVIAKGPPSDVVAGWCQRLADRVVGIFAKDCMDGGFQDSGKRSVEGRPLVARRILARLRPPAGRVLLISATHGDEPSSIGTAFRWVKMMTDGGTPYEWQVLPSLNPDGVFHQPATRVNANGVDLNRNLPTTGWAKESRAYWRRVGFEKRRFPGESAGSEPENRFLARQIRDFEPDVIITLHAPYGVLDYDGDFPPPRKLGHLNLHRLGVYPGSLGNFASRMQGIPVITIELEDARKPPGAAEIKRMWADLNGWLDRYLRSVRQAQADSPEGAG